MSNFPILFEDEDIIVISKPAGVVVNAADSVREETIQSWLVEKMSHEPVASGWQSLLPDEFSEEYGSPEEIFKERQGVVHRLDRDTSGVLLLGKNPGSMLNLMAQFKKREIEKEYTCLVHGFFPAKTDLIRLPLMRSMSQRHKFQVAANGKPAETHYTVQKEYLLQAEKLEGLLQNVSLRQGKTDAQLMKDYQSYGQFSLVRCQPKTGRTHQIRVHFAFLQHPLVGDQVYTNKWRGKADAFWCARQFLHASSVTFIHPRTHQKMTVTAPLEEDLLKALQFLVEKQP